MVLGLIIRVTYKKREVQNRQLVKLYSGLLVDQTMV